VINAKAEQSVPIARQFQEYCVDKEGQPMFDGYAMRLLPLLAGALIIAIVCLVITEVDGRKAKKQSK
jgi:hypothetical protein